MDLTTNRFWFPYKYFVSMHDSHDDRSYPSSEARGLGYQTGICVLVSRSIFAHVVGALRARCIGDNSLCDSHTPDCISVIQKYGRVSGVRFYVRVRG